MNELELIKFDYQKYIEDYMSLFRDAFPEVEDDHTKNGYLWQMQSYPNNKPSYEYAAMINKNLVGYYAAIPYCYLISGVEKKVGMVCGVMTGSKYRGKGIFTKLGEYSLISLKDNISFTTGFPIRKEVLPGHLKVGWIIAFELPLYIKFHSVSSLIRNKKKILSFTSPIINSILKTYNFLLNSVYNQSSFKTNIYNNISDIRHLDEFETQWRNNNTITLKKDLPFLKWRYSRPNAKYYYIVLENDDKIFGFCSFRKIIKEGVPSYGILDLRVIDNNIKYIKSIISTLDKKAKEDNIEVILMMMSKSMAKSYGIFKNGFIKSPFKFNLIINNVNNEYPDEFLCNENNWHLMWVDSDDL